MTLRDLAGRLDRAQGTLIFKIIASAVLLVAALAATVSYTVWINAEPPVASIAEPAPPPAQPGPEEGAVAGDAEDVSPELAQRRAADEVTARAIREILSRQADPTAVAVGAAVALGVCLIIVWLGLGLTYLALLLVTALVVLPMTLLVGDVPVFGAPSGEAREGEPLHWGDVGKFLGAVVTLTASFSALMQGLRLALDAGGIGRGGPIQAIARNVVAEAVRMKVSLVFIVLLVFALAALPGLLNESTPLRYRVQSFLQYGTGGAFWIIALLVLFLSVGTVAFEQRDRVIWQTMTKPVAPWQYLLGKWVGVSGVAAVLLAVATSGVFLFTEYLRNTPALGESAAYVSRAGGPGVLTEDRRILEEQVLAARRVTNPIIEPLAPDAFQAEIDRRIRAELALTPEAADAPGAVDDMRRRFADEIIQEQAAAARTIEAGYAKRFYFVDLAGAKQKARLLTLRYRIQSGGNDPRDFYRISMSIAGDVPISVEAPLDQTLTLDISTAAISPEGTLEIVVYNGEWRTEFPNPAAIHFPPDGLELYFSDGSYRANFLRVAVILWLKLAFIAMVGVVAATFLSFPVASLVAVGVFLMAEGAGFLSGSLNYFGGEWSDPEFSAWRFAVRMIAEPVTMLFQFYAKLRPTANLVEGRLVPWLAVLRAAALLGLLISVLYTAGVLIFRRRELATYSGQ